MYISRGAKKNFGALRAPSRFLPPLAEVHATPLSSLFYFSDLVNFHEPEEDFHEPHSEVQDYNDEDFTEDSVEEDR